MDLLSGLNSSMEHIYILKGEPVTFTKAGYNKDGHWGPCKEATLIYKISLEAQQENIQIYNTFISLKLDFYFLERIKSHHNKEKSKHYFCCDVPGILELSKWYIDLCTGIIWHDTKKIIKLEVEKHLDVNPRTELTVRTI